MKTLAPLLLAFSCSLVSAATVPTLNLQDEPAYSLNTDLITNCGSASDLMEIKDITLNPDPPRKGENLEISFTGFLKEAVPQGTTADVTVKFGVVQLLKQRFDLCEELKKVDEKCPIPKGNINFKKAVELPKEIPSGKYQVHAVITTPDRKQVTCLDAHTVFART
ncbi:ML domain-containing protein [Dichotomocladium elegans]|nr:ML domain-containing protein [Dichotomocladium elegans]